MRHFWVGGQRTHNSTTVWSQAFAIVECGHGEKSFITGAGGKCETLQLDSGRACKQQQQQPEHRQQ